MHSLVAPALRSLLSPSPPPPPPPRRDGASTGDPEDQAPRPPADHVRRGDAPSPSLSLFRNLFEREICGAEVAVACLAFPDVDPVPSFAARSFVSRDRGGVGVVFGFALEFEARSDGIVVLVV